MSDKVEMYKLKSGIKSAAENIKRVIFSEASIASLEDIESDLEYALEACKAMLAAEYKKRNDAHDADRRAMG